MADTYNIYITPSQFTITRLADNVTLFSSAFSYLNYDTSGAIKWPVGPTMSSAGGNLTWQFNNQQVVIRNTYYPNNNPKAFDTYLIPLSALNTPVVADNFTDTVVSQREDTASSV